ncbi:MAG: SCO family protein [Sphingomonadales bacterium]
MNLRLSLLPLLMLAACQAAPPPPLEGAKIGGPFTLVDQDGKTRTDRDFAGKYRIIYFGYTFCPDVCPVDVRNLAQGYRAFATANPEKGKQVVPIFITVDPARDTPSALKQFVSAFDPALIGLTGTSAQVDAAAKAYVVVYQLNKKTPGDTAYLVDHSRAAYLMDSDGKPVALLSQDEKPAVIAAQLAKWVK